MPAIGLLAGHAADEIPASHRALVECPPVAALTTLMPDGYPQTSVVWCDSDGACVRVNTMRGFAKERNMRRGPRVTLLCHDPRQPLRCLEVRGDVVEMTEEGAAERLDALASKYAGRPIRYFGECIPARFAETEIPVLCRIHARGERAADALTRTYTCHPRYYGFVYPETQQARETRIICRIHARRITLDAIHA